MTWDDLDHCLDNAMKIGRKKPSLPRSNAKSASVSLKDGFGSHASLGPKEGSLSSATSGGGAGAGGGEGATTPSSAHHTTATHVSLSGSPLARAFQGARPSSSIVQYLLFALSLPLSSPSASLRFTPSLFSLCVL